MVRARRYRAATATPQGDVPAAILVMSESVLVSTTETSFDGPFAV